MPYGKGREFFAIDLLAQGEVGKVGVAVDSLRDMERIFEDGFRGANAADISGTGHGLSFIKQVIDIHGGLVGCEPVEEGNNFYFVLPVPPPLANVDPANPDQLPALED